MKFDFTFTNTDDGSQVKLQGGRTSLWDAQDHCEPIKATRSYSGQLDFAWGYFAAKAAGKLAELGVDDGMDADEAIRLIADNFDMKVEDRTAPLAGRKG